MDFFSFYLHALTLSFIIQNNRNNQYMLVTLGTKHQKIIQLINTLYFTLFYFNILISMNS